MRPANDNIEQLLGALERSGIADTTRIVYSSDHGESLGNQGLYGKSNFYEESVGIPMIMAGPDVPSAHTVRTPVSLLDLYPTFTHAMNLPTATDVDASTRPGRSLFELAREEQPDRHVLSEQHSAGMPHAGFMLRHERWKYVHYAGGLQPQLFDTHDDPDEQTDLAAQPAHAPIRHNLETRLRTILDPDAVDRRAKADQQRRLELAGGAAAVLAAGSLGYTPAPGEQPDVRR